MCRNYEHIITPISYPLFTDIPEDLPDGGVAEDEDEEEEEEEDYADDFEEYDSEQVKFSLKAICV